MFIEQLYTGCLAEAAYYIESEGEAVVIDPLRETEPYLEMAARRGARIKYIFETHFHADFVSGHIDLARKTGATIVYGPLAKALYDIHVATDGEIFKVGKLTLETIHTPGHTLESTCWLLRDESEMPHAVFTGDTLFVGAVGRPDLAVKGDNPITPQELASHLYDSLNNKIKRLPEDVIVYPGHGAGSACGKGIGKETWSTIGQQLKSNYALQPMTREEFIQEVTEGLGAPPAYFFEDARINITGYESIDTVMERNMKLMSPAEVEAVLSAGATLLDTRSPEAFEKGFIPGALNIGLDGTFAVWVGTLLSIRQQLVIVAPEGRERETVLRLARVGYENVAGVLSGGMDAWTAAGMPVDQVNSIAPEALASAMQQEGAEVLDVRNPNEAETGRVKGARVLPLAELPRLASTLNPEKTYLVHCAGGYRSMVASSILKANGIENIVNVYGGFGKIKETGIAQESGPLGVTA